MKQRYTFIVIGGGAAGFFAAIHAKTANQDLSVLLLEKTGNLLSKVRISGGGRCNVTHACFDPRLLVNNYPRGGRELIGPFTRFQPRDTVNWFESKNVPLKVESDGRIFPTSNQSESIIECLMREANLLGVEIQTKQNITQLKKEQDGFCISLDNEHFLYCDHLLLATGSHPQGHAWARSLGHTIQNPVPSLFALNMVHFPLVDIAGITFEKVKVELPDVSLHQTGSLLITHWGFSGPAPLKLSSWAARYLNEKNYQAELFVDWLPDVSLESIFENFKTLRTKFQNQIIGNNSVYHLPKNFWKKFLELALVDPKKRLSDISNEIFLNLSKKLKKDVYQINGKTTHKEEFVTCGGVSLNEINFKSMESRCCSGLYFAGEILDIDAVTGGFNFQNAWTTGWLAGNAVAG
jgi:predicted Rossmann fold flavoprotein